MNPPAIARHDITGLVLAGGRGSRMGGVDKGLQSYRGEPLARHALDRLAPQVGPLRVNANRHLDRYAAFGAPVWPDATDAGLEGFAGPLAGFLAGLDQCGTRWLVTVPCDSPDFPADLVAQLAAATVAEGAVVAMPETFEDGRWQAQPVFCLMRADLRDDLAAFLRGGQRHIVRWIESQRCARVRFDDAAAFANVNTPEDLQRLQRG